MSISLEAGTLVDLVMSDKSVDYVGDAGGLHCCTICDDVCVTSVLRAILAAPRGRTKAH